MHPRMEEVVRHACRPGSGVWIESSPRVLGFLRPRGQSRPARARPARSAGSWRSICWRACAASGAARCAIAASRRISRPGSSARARRRAATIALAVEILEARRLVKGYSDTHDAGEGKFSRLMAMAEKLEGRADAADWMRRLRQAALADAEGRALDDTIKTIESFL